MSELCPICKQVSKHIEGCPNHPNYFKECLMDAHYARSQGKVGPK